MYIIVLYCIFAYLECCQSHKLLCWRAPYGRDCDDPADGSLHHSGSGLVLYLLYEAFLEVAQRVSKHCDSRHLSSTCGSQQEIAVNILVEISWEGYEGYFSHYACCVIMYVYYKEGLTTMQRKICFSVSGFREEWNKCKSGLWARSYNICLLNVTCSL